MPQLASIDKLQSIFAEAFKKAERHIKKTRADVLNKREWLDTRTEEYKDSDAHAEWEDFLHSSEALLSDIEYLAKNEIISDVYAFPDPADTGPGAGYEQESKETHKTEDI